MVLHQQVYLQIYHHDHHQNYIQMKHQFLLELHVLYVHHLLLFHSNQMIVLLVLVLEHL